MRQFTLCFPHLSYSLIVEENHKIKRLLSLEPQNDPDFWDYYFSQSSWVTCVEVIRLSTFTQTRRRIRSFVSVESGLFGVTLEGSFEGCIEKLILPSLMRSNNRIFDSIASSVGEFLRDLVGLFVSRKGVLIGKSSGLKTVSNNVHAHQQLIEQYTKRPIVHCTRVSIACTDMIEINILKCLLWLGELTYDHLRCEIFSGATESSPNIMRRGCVHSSSEISELQHTVFPEKNIFWFNVSKISITIDWKGTSLSVAPMNEMSIMHVR